MITSVGRGVTAILLGAVASASCQVTEQADDAPASSVRGEDWDSLGAFAATIPSVEVPELDLEMALTLAAMPLSCLDRPHAAPRDRRTYLDTLVSRRVPGYESTRAFYGCWDWHSAVNSTWTMVRILKEFPKLPVSGLIEEKLDEHLAEEALGGEVAFFEDNRTFERPYGWAWLLRLYAELSTWDHPDAEQWADHLEPLAALLSERSSEYLADLKLPSRSGAHSNTSFSLAMMIDAARLMRDRKLEQAALQTARRLFYEDVDCPTGYEPWGSDFLSPCLEEAALMSEVLDQADYVTWLDGFLPLLSSPAFEPLTSPTDPEDVVEDVRLDPVAPPGWRPDSVDAEGVASAERIRADAERRAMASTSHLIGLAFIRADAMLRIGRALPPEDARVPVLRRLAQLHGARGFEAMFNADYAGSHWIGTFALDYLLAERLSEQPPARN